MNLATILLYLLRLFVLSAVVLLFIYPDVAYGLAITAFILSFWAKAEAKKEQ